VAKVIRISFKNVEIKRTSATTLRERKRGKYIE